MKKRSEWFVTNKGLRQGSVLSLILFNVVMNDIIKKVKEYEPNEDI